METGLVLSIGSLGFLILLLISYQMQQRSISVTNKLYRLMVFILIITVIAELLCSYNFLYNKSNNFNNFLIRLYWFINIVTFIVFYLYSISFLKDKKDTTIIELIKNDKEILGYAIFSLVCLLVYWFLPFKNLTKETFTFLPGISLYFVIPYCAIIFTSIILSLIKRYKEIDIRRRKAAIIMTVELSITFVFQIIFSNTAFLGLGCTLQVYFLYFYIENPDLLMINEMEKLKKDVERSSMAKTDFLSNMSHEIRSPMNSIVGFSETILNEPNFNEESIRTDIKHISSAGNNLLDIVNNILDISKIETGNETLEEKEYSIGNVIMELSSIIDSRLANRNINFITNIDSGIPKKIYGDSTKLFQVLLNILTNSIKYTEVGKINLSVTHEIKNNYVTLKFKVSDTGYGIKKEDYDNLFQKFSRLDNATTNEIEGTGLGLVITKRYVDLLGGKIWFESDYGVGTTFYVEVTQRIIDTTPLGDIRENQNTEVKEDTYLDCTGKTVLVVDDNMLNIKVAKRILAKYKFTFDSATNGKDCIYRIKEGKHYDIIFLDHMIPEMDGIEVVHVLKKLKDFDIPPVVALTANAITGVRDMYLREGFDEYLSKPINTSELNHIINRYFSNNN